MAGTGKIRHPKKRAFLAAYAETGNIAQSAQTAGIHRNTHYDWLQKDEKYVEAFAAAEEEAADRLEAEARRRAVEGVDEPVFYQGERCGVVRKYSDTLLIFLLKGARPEKYKDRQAHEHSGPGGGPIPVAKRLDLTQLSDEELESLESIIANATSAAGTASDPDTG